MGSYAFLDLESPTMRDPKPTNSIKGSRINLKVSTGKERIGKIAAQRKGKHAKRIIIKKGKKAERIKVSKGKTKIANRKAFSLSLKAI